MKIVRIPRQFVTGCSMAVWEIKFAQKQREEQSITKLCLRFFFIIIWKKNIFKRFLNWALLLAEKDNAKTKLSRFVHNEQHAVIFSYLKPNFE